jgi:hypothetical protein
MDVEQMTNMAKIAAASVIVLVLVDKCIERLLDLSNQHRLDPQKGLG